MPSHSPMSASSSRAVGSPSRAASVMNGPVSAAGVAAEPGEQVGHDGRPGLDHRAGLAHEGVAAGVLLPAAAVAALAAHAARHDLHVAELAGDAVPPALDVAVDDEGAPDARAEGDDDDVRLAPGGTEASPRPRRPRWRRCRR